jgi:hypothetical protein
MRDGGAVGGNSHRLASRNSGSLAYFPTIVLSPGATSMRALTHGPLSALGPFYKASGQRAHQLKIQHSNPPSSPQFSAQRPIRLVDCKIVLGIRYVVLTLWCPRKFQGTALADWLDGCKINMLQLLRV